MHRNRLISSAFFAVLLFCLPLFSEEVIHVLQKGETLYAISRKYGVSLDSIITINRISDPSRLQAGQRLRIPTVYEIQKGDTLFGIARKLNVPVDDILSINSLSRSSVIKAGDILLVPVTEETRAKSSPGPVVSDQRKNDVQNKIVLEDPRVFESRTVDPSVIWPIEAQEISWLTGKVQGVTITGTGGEKVKAITSGTVLSRGPFRGFGQVLFVQTRSGYIYVYGGLEGKIPTPGQTIAFGEELGNLSIDSLSGKPRLYFMVYNKDIPVDPVKAPRGY